MNIVTTHSFSILSTLVCLYGAFVYTNAPEIKIACHSCTSKSNYKIILWDKSVTFVKSSLAIKCERRTCGGDNYNDTGRGEEENEAVSVIDWLVMCHQNPYNEA